MTRPVSMIRQAVGVAQIAIGVGYLVLAVYALQPTHPFGTHYSGFAAMVAGGLGVASGIMGGLAYRGRRGAVWAAMVVSVLVSLPVVFLMPALALVTALPLALGAADLATSAARITS
jgi:hypothetical protein